MTTKPKRPAILDLGSMMVSPLVGTTDAAPSTETEVLPSAPQPDPAAKITKTPKPDPAMFRTSVYFSRAVHDKLRDIAHEERKTITDLINEGLDHVLTSRNYPNTAELKKERA